MIRGHRVLVLDPLAKRAPFLEYDNRTRRWRVWLAFDDAVDNGTYLDLFASGECDRVTTQSGGIVMDITRLTGPVV